MIILNELKMLTQDEVAELLNIHRTQVTMLRQVGILKAIKTGRNFMFSQDTIKAFQHDYAGYDVSNVENARASFNAVNTHAN